MTTPTGFNEESIANLQQHLCHGTSVRLTQQECENLILGFVDWMAEGGMNLHDLGKLESFGAPREEVAEVIHEFFQEILECDKLKKR